MKKKIVSLLLVAFALTFAGCSSNDEKENKKDTVNQESEVESEEEIMNNNEEAKEAIEESIADSEAMETEEEIVEETKVIEPCQEILDAEFSDLIFQIDDFVIKFDPYESVEDFVKHIPEGYSIDVETNMLVSDHDQQTAKVYKGDVETGEYVFAFSATNFSDGTVDFGDLKMRSLGFNQNYSGSIFIAKGISILNSYDYSQDERFSYENIEQTIQDWGAVKIDTFAMEDEDLGQKTSAYCDYDGLKYNVIGIGDQGTILNTWGAKAMIEFPRYYITFEIDKTTRQSMARIDYSWTPAVSGWVLPSDYEDVIDCVTFEDANAGATTTEEED